MIWKWWYVFSQKNYGLYSLGWYMNLFLGYWFPNILQIIRLLANHPQFKITLMTADRKAGQSIESVFPHLVSQVRISMSSSLIRLFSIFPPENFFGFIIHSSLIRYNFTFLSGFAKPGCCQGCRFFFCGCSILLFTPWNNPGFRLFFAISWCFRLMKFTPLAI